MEGSPATPPEAAPAKVAGVVPIVFDASAKPGDVLTVCVRTPAGCHAAYGLKPGYCAPDGTPVPDQHGFVAFIQVRPGVAPSERPAAPVPEGDLEAALAEEDRLARAEFEKAQTAFRHAHEAMAAVEKRITDSLLPPADKEREEREVADISAQFAKAVNSKSKRTHEAATKRAQEHAVRVRERNVELLGTWRQGQDAAREARRLAAEKAAAARARAEEGLPPFTDIPLRLAADA